MITRTTTVGSLKNYRFTLNHSMTTMSTALNKIATQRNFNSFAENPAIAARAFQLRHAYLRTSSQYDANTSLLHKYNQAWSSLDGVEKDIDTIDQSGFYNLIRAENGADASGRNALGQDMAAKAKSIIQTMNGRHGENYVFAGSDTLNVPFTWEPMENPNYNTDLDSPVHYQYIADPAKAADSDGNPVNVENDPDILVVDGKYYTNNINKAEATQIKNPAYDQWKADVDAGLLPPDCPKVPEYTTQYTLNDTGDTAYDPNATKKYIQSTVTFKDKPGGNVIKTETTYTDDVTKAHQQLCYRGVPVDCTEGSAAEQRLDYYVHDETKDIDIGIGFKEKDGEAVPSSVHNSALQGVYYLGGYGTKDVTIRMDPDDPDSERTVTVPTNIASIMSRLGTIMMNCDPDDGHFASEDEEAEFYALAQQFEDTSSVVKQRYTELDTTAKFLESNGELLVENADNLQDQFMGIEDVDPAAAISDFMFARYAYDSALKVGNSILAQSLMDYMSF